MKTIYSFYEVSYGTVIAKSHEIIVSKYFFLCLVFFCMFPCSKGFLVRAYLDTI